MTKEKLQQELQEKVRPGIKPSQLKRSKSLGDIPKAPLLPDQPTIQQLQTENKELKSQLAKANQDWTNLAQKRLENLKSNPNPRLAELEKELNQTVKDATEEIEKQEQIIKSLKQKLSQVQNQNQDLTQQVKNYERATELRINTPAKEPNSNWWNDHGPIIIFFGLYALSAWLLNKPRNNHYE